VKELLPLVAEEDLPKMSHMERLASIVTKFGQTEWVDKFLNLFGKYYHSWVDQMIALL
jgi:hypothetical protein